MRLLYAVSGDDLDAIAETIQNLSVDGSWERVGITEIYEMASTPHFGGERRRLAVEWDGKAQDVIDAVKDGYNHLLILCAKEPKTLSGVEVRHHKRNTTPAAVRKRAAEIAKSLGVKTTAAGLADLVSRCENEPGRIRAILKAAAIAQIPIEPDTVIELCYGTNADPWSLTKALEAKNSKAFVAALEVATEEIRWLAWMRSWWAGKGRGKLRISDDTYRAGIQLIASAEYASGTHPGSHLDTAAVGIWQLLHGKAPVRLPTRRILWSHIGAVTV